MTTLLLVAAGALLGVLAGPSLADLWRAGERAPAATIAAAIPTFAVIAVVATGAAS